MRECPWCGRMNLNVYAYCHGCGRGFAEPPAGGEPGFGAPNLGMWLAGANPAGALSAFWPMVGVLAAIAFGTTLLWGSQSDHDLAGPLIGGAAGFLAIVVVGWMAASAAAGRNTDIERGTRYAQIALVEAGPATATAFTRWLRNARELRRLPGVDTTVASIRRSGGSVSAMIRIELDDATGPGAEAIERVIRNEAGDQAQVQVFPPQDAGTAPEPRARMSGAAAATLVGGLLVGGVALAGTYAAMDGSSDGGDGDTPAPTAAPQAFNGTIGAKNTKFIETSITLPPNTEVTLRFDNQDASPPHNIQFFAGASASGALLGGCTAGCAGGDVATEIATGPVVQEFTFTTPGPGTYAYNCIVHPVEMLGTLEVVEGAPPPA